jgi:hypothetical protein
MSNLTIQDQNDEYIPLIWSKGFKFVGLVKIHTIGDGSCFFHALLNSFFKPYITCFDGRVPVKRKELVSNFRTDLSKNLKFHYDQLSRGKLKELSRDNKELTLENLEKTLASSQPIDNRFNEYISNMIDKDIYILDFKKQDIYITGDDDEILLKNRDSVVLIYNEETFHYELVGLLQNNFLITLFHSDDPLIYAIRKRMNELRKK